MVVKKRVWFGTVLYIMLPLCFLYIVVISIACSGWLPVHGSGLRFKYKAGTLAKPDAVHHFLSVVNAWDPKFQRFFYLDKEQH